VTGSHHRGGQQVGGGGLAVGAGHAEREHRLGPRGRSDRARGNRHDVAV
jgi:hypothetical protein